MVMDGSVFRKSAQVLYREGGNELRIEAMRLGDNYSLKIVYVQSTREGVAVNMVADGFQHPLELKLYGDVITRLQPQKDEIVRSTAGRDEITYENTYELTGEQVKSIALAPVTRITIKCFGTELKRGVEKDNIEIAVSRGQAEKFSEDMRCILRDEPAPSISLPESAGRAEQANDVQVEKEPGESSIYKATAKKPSLSTTDSLLVEILARMDASKDSKPEKEFTPRVFGFGVYFKTNYTFSSISTAAQDLDLVINKFMSGASINMSFNAGMKKKVGFRFEPFVDFLVTNTENQYGSTNLKSEIGFFETGMRLLLMIRRNRVNIYPGLSASYVNISGRAFSGGSSGVKATRSGGSVGLILGGEYLLTPNIGVRLESGLMYYGLGKIASNNATFSNKAQNIFGSFARIGGSFYF